jgi:hypothetical protein
MSRFISDSLCDSICMFESDLCILFISHRENGYRLAKQHISRKTNTFDVSSGLRYNLSNLPKEKEIAVFSVRNHILLLQ